MNYENHTMSDLTNYSETLFSHPPEYYRHMHDKTIQKALAFERGENVKTVQIPESGLEEHFEATWGDDQENYNNDIYLWRGTGSEVKTLTKIQLDETGDTGYVVDTFDCFVGKKSDEFMFYMVGTCWAVVVDMDQDRRVVYHMPGSTPDKGTSLEEFVKALGAVGKVDKISVFYNHGNFNPNQNREEVLEDTKKRFAEVALNFYNMNELMPHGSFDLFIRGDTAKQFYTLGFFNIETDEAREDRLHAGDWEIK